MSFFFFLKSGFEGRKKLWEKLIFFIDFNSLPWTNNLVSIHCIQLCISQTADTYSLCYSCSFLAPEESKVQESRSFQNVSQKERCLLFHYTMLSSSWLCFCNWFLSCLPVLDIRLLTKSSAVLCPAWNSKHAWVSTSNSWLLFPFLPMASFFLSCLVWPGDS